MKTTKKSFILFFLISFIFTMFFNVVEVKADTLRDYYKQLDNLKDKKKAQESAKALTEKEYRKVASQINDTQHKISEGQKKIAAAKNKIIELKQEIAEKKAEINKVLSFLQISSGENIYLEYVFGAQDLTDFIYRSSVVEQISEYNNNLITEMNNLIEENIQLQKDLAEEEKKLAALLKTLAVQLDSLGSRLQDFEEDALTIDEQIKVTKASISYYESQNCGMDEEISNCVKVPYGTGFVRPLVRGLVTSLYGARSAPCSGCSTFHRGIDLAIAEGTPVYASAPGIVLASVSKSSCGGNMLFIKHIISGEYYTTFYEHLLSFNVSVGDVVNIDTVIGYVGGGATTKVYDRCTTGAHLHLGIFKGWTTNLYNSVNPQDYIYFPPLGSWFNSRYY